MRTKDIQNHLIGAICQPGDRSGSFISSMISKLGDVIGLATYLFSGCVVLQQMKHAEIQYRDVTNFNSVRNKQTGSTLIVSLIILILLMLLGVTAMSTSDTQYKLTGNLQFANMALNNAETAASTAEKWLEDNAGSTPSANAIATLPNPLTGMTWTNSDSTRVDNDDKKRYVIGYVSTNASPTAGVGLDCLNPSNEHNFDCVNTYIITARGQGGRGATKIIQTYYAVPLK